ncbi:ABC-type sugar transport system [Cutibacterium acnes JCM 18918]|nr:ABC-type sugar transport system [Cutibacterium acnes JCM 18918]
MAVYNLVTTGDYFGAAARSVILAVITLVASFGFLKLQSRRGGAFDE